MFPIEIEIDDLVRDLSKEKALDIDGITIEVLQRFWHVMKLICTTLIHADWVDGKLTSRTIVGVIKLIPQNSKVL